MLIKSSISAWPAQRKASGFGVSGGLSGTLQVKGTCIVPVGEGLGVPLQTKSLGSLGEGVQGPLQRRDTSGVGLCGLLHCRGGAGGWGLVHPLTYCATQMLLQAISEFRALCRQCRRIFLDNYTHPLISLNAMCMHLGLYAIPEG